jgi:hypothetical protein
MLGIPYRGSKIEAKGGIPFRTIPQKRKQLGIPFRRTKIKLNLPEFRRRNPDPARNRSLGSSVPHNKTRPPQILKIEPEKTTFVCSGKLIIPRNSVPFRASEWALPRNLKYPRNEHFLPRNNGINSESILWNFYGLCVRDNK